MHELRSRVGHEAVERLLELNCSSDGQPHYRTTSSSAHTYRLVQYRLAVRGHTAVRYTFSTLSRLEGHHTSAAHSDSKRHTCCTALHSPATTTLPHNHHISTRVGHIITPSTHSSHTLLHHLSSTSLRSSQLLPAVHFIARRTFPPGFQYCGPPTVAGAHCTDARFFTGKSL